MDEAPSDREQIGDVLVRYATGIDTQDWPLFRSCFTDDVRADYGDIGVWNDVEAITEFMRVTHATMPSTKHMLSNVAITLSGDTASARTYVHAVLVVTAEPEISVDAIGQYDDELVRTSDGWRIRARTFTLTRQSVSGGEVR